MKHQITYQDYEWESAGIKELYQKKKYALEDYIDRLLWWNRKVNLISRSVSRETLQKHVEHSLSLSAIKEVKEASLIVDAGTGGGLPGIPLAIVLDSKKLILNDVVEKKLMAVKQIAMQLGLSERVKVVAESVERLRESDFVLVSKHAFKVNELYAMVKDQDWKDMILLKGRDEVEGELKGIKEALKIRILDLYGARKDGFYEGKALVIIKRGENEKR
ncbi:16S rRNA (guanine(527)-N(7))-methyltransferase RsmG [Balneola sp. MJW-20]|uniref:16S rRNA (guanine(527)-N(7))-methyltransferase RsmG n=1 Tax=Gracilimonas aurantiaca TaxID=3234185 RepID=UPI0034674957